MRPPPEMGGRWPKQARHTSQMDRLRMRGEEVAVAAPARPSGRDGVMASPPPRRRRWLLEGAGAALFQHVLTASTVTYDQAEHCPIRLHAWADNQAIAFGGGPRGRERLRCKVIAYMKNAAGGSEIRSGGLYLVWRKCAYLAYLAYRGPYLRIFGVLRPYLRIFVCIFAYPFSSNIIQHPLLCLTVPIAIPYP